MSPSDDECVRACLNDHPEAFRPRVRRYETPLTRHLCGRLGNADEAAEAAREAFVRAYFALGGLRNPAVFLPWLLGIADRVVKETRRAARRHRTVEWEQGEPVGSAGKRETAG